MTYEERWNALRAAITEDLESPAQFNEYYEAALRWVLELMDEEVREMTDKTEYTERRCETCGHVESRGRYTIICGLTGRKKPPTDRCPEWIPKEEEV